MKLRKVLVTVDPGNVSQPAVERALHLQRFADFEMKLVSCSYTQYLVEGYYFDALDLPRLREEYRQERSVLLESLAQPLRDQGVNVVTEAFWGRPMSEILVKQASHYQADLVIHHTGRLGVLSRMFLTHDDWQLVRCCPVPLLLVKEKAWSDPPVLMVAVDPMQHRHKPDELDHKLLKVAGDLAQASGGSVHAVHSYNPPPLSGDHLSEAGSRHREALANLMADFTIPVANQHLVEEAAELAMSRLEKTLNADLVVMGAISRNILADVFIGNTTERVVDSVGCDVLIIKPDDFESPLKP